MRCLVLLSLCVLGALAVSPPVHGGAERMRFRAEAQTSTRMTEGEILRRVINWDTVLKGKFPKALKYATGKDLDVNKEMGVEATRGLYFDTQLTRAGRQEAVERFIDEFIKYVDSASKLPGVKWNTNAKAVAANADDVLLNIFRLLFEESFTDPTYYVSHAADHGARVMILAHNYLLNIKGAMKGLQKQLFGSDTDPIHPQSPTENYIWFFMDLANLLHDCGYNGLPKNQSPPQKWTHAVNGAFLLKKRLGALLVDFLPKGHFQKVFDAVRYHNMDNKEKGEMSESGRNGELKVGQYQPTAWKSRAGLPYAFPDDIDGTQKDTFTHPDVHKVLNDGSSGPDFRVDGVGSLPLGTPNEENSWPKEMWREYKTAQLGSAETELWLLRFADNMDASRGRLTVNQASENAEKCYARLYADEVARRDVCGKWFKANGDLISMKNKDHVAAMQEIKDAAAEAVKTIKATYQPCIDAKKAAATPQEDVISPKQIDARSFLHMYSNWAVEKTGLVSEKDATKVTFAALLSGTGDLAVANYPEVALYQINRMAEALQSLTMADGTSVTDFVDVKITGHPLKELAKDTKLSAFNINTANAAKPNKCAIFNKIHQPEIACYKDPDAKKTTACVDFHPDLHGAACGAKDPAPPNKYCVIASLV